MKTISWEKFLKKLDSPDAYVREEIVSELGNLGGEDALQALLKQLAMEEDSDIKKTIVYALGKIGSEKAIASLKECLNSDDFEMRWVAVEALDKIATPECYELLITRLKNESIWNVRAAIIKALSNYNSLEVIKTLLTVLANDEEFFVRQEAYLSLEKLRSTFTAAETITENKYIGILSPEIIGKILEIAAKLNRNLAEDWVESLVTNLKEISKTYSPRKWGYTIEDLLNKLLGIFEERSNLLLAEKGTLELKQIDEQERLVRKQLEEIGRDIHERLKEPKNQEEEEESLTMNLFLDFLVKDADKNPEQLVPYTEEMSQEIDDLLVDVKLEDE